MRNDIRFKEVNSEFLKGEIHYYADCNKIEADLQEECIKYIENAFVIELGGSYCGDHTYMAVRDDNMFLVDCGVWD